MPAPWYTPLQKALLVTEVLAGHIVAGTIVLTGGFWINRLLMENGDPKAYDLVPWRYVMDTGDLLIMIAIVVFGIIGIKEAEEEP